MSDETIQAMYILTPRHKSIIVEAARRQGNSSLSAALRKILDDWARDHQIEQASEERLGVIR